MKHWTAPFYQCVDAGDPRVAEYFAPDVHCQVGNAPADVGLQAMFKGAIGRIVVATRGSNHRFINIWDQADNTAVVESVVTYLRRDGRDVTVPAMTVLRRNSDGLIDMLRLYIDTSPLFDGWEQDSDEPASR